MNIRLAIHLIALAALFIAPAASAQVPDLLNYQGRLIDTAGYPVPDGDYTVTFLFYGQSTGGTALWAEPHSVPVKDGLFDVVLGETAPIPIHLITSGDVWLSLALGAVEVGDRQRLTSVVYALRARYADSVGVADDGDWTVSGPDLYRLDGNVGIGTPAPMTKLDVAGVITALGGNSDNWNTSLQQSANLSDLSSAANARANLGLGSLATLNAVNDANWSGASLSLAHGGTGATSASGARTNLGLGSLAILNSVNNSNWSGTALALINGGTGATTASAARTNLGLGSLATLSTINNGNWSGTDLAVANGGTGVSSFSSGYLLKGAGSSAVGSSTVYDNGRVGIGTSSPDAKLAVSTTTEPGATVRNNSSGSVALWAYNTGGTALSCGTGASGSPAMTAISYNNAASQVAIRANGIIEATSYILASSALTNQNAVTGSCASNFSGVAGIATGGGNGVFGSAGTGYAGYFSGKAAVTGTLSKGGGSFKIDHPLDPENKYLYHSFVESPDMMNVYNGNVVLGGSGEATVELPGYFEALNRDFRYQLTCVGGYAPVYIAEKVANNRFRIAGGTPGLEVSWQVTGIRQDAFANANRIPVEEDKDIAHRGKFLHPEALGRDATLSIDYEDRERMLSAARAVQTRGEEARR